MNTANLQLEGLVMAIAGLTQALVEKGVISTEEIDRALSISEQNALADERIVETLTPANRDAIAFPIRVLRLANSMAGNGGAPSFGQLARLVGQTKQPYNDQI